MFDRRVHIEAMIADLTRRLLRWKLMTGLVMLFIFSVSAAHFMRPEFPASLAWIGLAGLLACIHFGDDLAQTIRGHRRTLNAL